MAGEKIMVDERKLQLYLKKCELEYRAKHSQNAECLDWLAPYCGTVEWVETTSGILVYVGTDGLFAKIKI